MDNMLKIIAEMSNTEQEKAFIELEQKLGKEITDKLRERTFYIKLFTNKVFYDSAMNGLANNLYNTLSK